MALQLLLYPFMDVKNKYKEPLNCFISAYHIPKLDPFLEKNQFCAGMIIFAIPELGIMFRCRANGDLIDMEFAAFFSLLKFITTDIKDEKIRAVIIFSSNPEFIFSFTGNSSHLTHNSSRMVLINEYQKKINIKMSYIEPIRNKSLIPASEYPSLPVDKRVFIKPSNELFKSSFKPFQKGISI